MIPVLLAWYVAGVALVVILLDSAEKLGAPVQVTCRWQWAVVGLHWRVMHMVRYEEEGRPPTEVLVEHLRNAKRELQVFLCPLPCLVWRIIVRIDR